MTRKRKNADTFASRVSRPRTVIQPRTRVITAYRSDCGKLGQTTSYVDARGNAQDASSSADVVSVPDPTLSTLDPTFEFPSCDDGLDVLPQDEDDFQPNDSQERESKESYHTTRLRDWATNYRQHYLDELIWHDGCGACEQCVDCKGKDADFKCRDCFGLGLLCKACFVARHTFLPFHRILHWTGTFFEDLSTKSLGIVVHLGHNGTPCRIPADATKDFTVIDTNGIHHVVIQFCGCFASRGGAHQYKQLLRARLLPSSDIQPTIAFTFNLLDAFHLLTLQGKMSAYDYYLSLEHMTDNMGSLEMKQFYKQFLSAVRIWHHLKLLKRSGHAHDPLGVEATKAGSCTVECLACPHPGRNLPVGWEDAPPSKAWLYTPIMTVDANFWLKCKDRKVKGDMPLGDGWGYWVPESDYQAYIEVYGYQRKPNLCQSELRAVDHANTKISDGYVATGIGGVICARHTLVRKNALGDLQKGERYANMDFLIFSTIAGLRMPSLTISYDIACQWSCNVRQRVRQLPVSMQPGKILLDNMRYVIPKCHISCHGSQCQTSYSLNYLQHSARTNGEEPERFWAHMNPISMSTKEMGQDACHDTIDDHVAAWNWRKITGLGRSLSDQLRKAIKMKARHKALLEQFTAHFSPKLIDSWNAIIVAWDVDRSQPCPYEEPEMASTMAQVRIELVEEELANVTKTSMMSDVPMNVFLNLGLELEEQQRRLKQALHSKSSLLQQADHQEKRAMLRRHIEKWREMQSLCMPAISQLQLSDNEGYETESILLYLPSGFPPDLKLSDSLRDREQRLRVAQVKDALFELRRLLRMLLGLRDYKVKQVGYGQRANTRARSLIARYQEKVNLCADRYQAARQALLSLDAKGLWSEQFLDLKPEHVKPPRRDCDDESEGRREVSWIWMVKPDSKDEVDEEVELDQGLRSEWARSHARAARWAEEVALLVEEMQRILWFVKWKIEWWVTQGTLRNKEEVIQPEILDGLKGYAIKQAAVWEAMGMRFATEWYALLKSNGLPMEWPDSYLNKWVGLVIPTEENVDSDDVDYDDFDD